MPSSPTSFVMAPKDTVALVVSHAQAEDLADRVRQRLAAASVLHGASISGPGWTTDRRVSGGRQAAAALPPRRSPLTADQRHRRNHRGRRQTTASHSSPIAANSSSCPQRSSPEPVPTGRRTSRTRGHGPSTAPKAALGTTPICSAPPPWTRTAATPPNPAPANQPTRGTPPPCQPSTSAVASPTNPTPTIRSPPPSLGSPTRRWPRSTTHGSSTANSARSSPPTKPSSIDNHPTAKWRCARRIGRCKWPMRGWSQPTTRSPRSAISSTISGRSLG